MRIDNEQVKHVAALARLKIEEKDIEKLSDEMGDIIEFADSLNELDVSGVDGSALENLTVFNVFREDELGESYPREEVLANAPEKYDGCYIVPKIIE